MPSGRTSIPDAKPSDTVIKVECCGEKVWVLAYMRERWKCGKCKSRGAGHQRYRLGPKGTEPTLIELE